jgi:glycosyltransferase involved in cell wall biosynthesis
MRLGILNWRDLAHPKAGGAEVFVHEVGRRWASSGHEVTLYTSRARGLDRHGEADGLRLVRVGRLHDGSHHVLAPFRVQRDRPDVVLESVNTIPYELPLRTRRFPPYLTLVHQMAVDVWDAHLPSAAASVARRIEPLMFRLYKNANVAVVSESTAWDLRNAGVVAPMVVPQGGIGPQARGSKESTPTIIFVGRLAGNKRPDHAVEAFRIMRQSIPEARMWIVGQGPMHAGLSSRLPEGAEMLGHLPREELLDRMSRAHLLVATSVREGWGLVITEANALGTPAVAYDVPGLRDSVRRNVTGMLVESKPASLARAIESLLEDSQRYEAMVAQASSWGATFSWERTAEWLLDAVRSSVRLASASSD